VSAAPAATADFAARDASAAPQRGELAGFSLTCQEEDNWCWAAVSQAVEAFGRRRVSQESVASDHIQASGRAFTCAPPNRTETTAGACGSSGCDTACNGPHSLGRVLNERSLLSSYITQGAPILFDQLVHEITARGRPVPCRIEWGGGWGHFVCVFGWATDTAGNRYVTVHDPLHPGKNAGPAHRREIRYDDFCNRYALGLSVGTNNYAYAVR
jgi:hypothetical protein